MDNEGAGKKKSKSNYGLSLVSLFTDIHVEYAAFIINLGLSMSLQTNPTVPMNQTLPTLTMSGHVPRNPIEELVQRDILMHIQVGPETLMRTKGIQTRARTRTHRNNQIRIILMLI